MKLPRDIRKWPKEIQERRRQGQCYRCGVKPVYGDPDTGLNLKRGLVVHRSCRHNRSGR